MPFKGDEPTYTLGLDWQVDERIFAYIAHRRGFRSGGVNAPAFVSPRTEFLRRFQSYGAEKITDVELGIKTDFRLADIPVRFNISAFRSKYSNVQTSFNVANLLGPPPLPADSPQNNALIINSGARRFTGFETELVVRPTPRLAVGGNAAYIKQKVTENGVPTDLPGLIPPSIVSLSPKWSASGNVRWQLPLPEQAGEIFLNADYYYQSNFNVQNALFDGYDVVNARLEWQEIADSPISAAAFVRNVFDSEYFDAAGATAASLGFLSGHIAEPRTYGFEVSVRF